MVISYPKCMVAPLKERDLVEHLFWENMKQIIWEKIHNSIFSVQRQWNQQRTCCGKFTINVSGLPSHFNNCLAQNFFWIFRNKTSTKPAGAEITYLTGSCVARKCGPHNSHKHANSVPRENLTLYVFQTTLK